MKAILKQENLTKAVISGHPWYLKFELKTAHKAHASRLSSYFWLSYSKDILKYLAQNIFGRNQTSLPLAGGDQAVT